MRRTKQSNIFPNLAYYMACKGMNQKDLANLLHKTQSAVSRKLRGESDFLKSEMVTLRDHFRDINPNLTMDELFKIFYPDVS